MRTFNLDHSAANICTRRTYSLFFFFLNLWCSLAPLWHRYCTLTRGGRRWRCFILEALLLRPRAAHRHTLDGWVMAARDGRTFPLAGSQDSEKPKTAGKQRKGNNICSKIFDHFCCCAEMGHGCQRLIKHLAVVWLGGISDGPFFTALSTPLPDFKADNV